MKETTLIQQEGITALPKVKTISNAYSYLYSIESFRWEHSKNVPFTIKSMKSKSMGMYSEIPEESIQIVLSTTCNVVQGLNQALHVVKKLGDYFFSKPQMYAFKEYCLRLFVQASWAKLENYAFWVSNFFLSLHLYANANMLHASCSENIL